MKPTFEETYKKAVTHKGKRLLPSGGEPEAIYDYMCSWVDDAEDEAMEDEEIREKEIDELKDEIKELELDFEALDKDVEARDEIIKRFIELRKEILNFTHQDKPDCSLTQLKVKETYSMTKIIYGDKL